MAHASYLMVPSRGPISYRRPTTCRSLVRGSLSLVALDPTDAPYIIFVPGIGDLTKINVPAGDAGGELDPHGADGNGKGAYCLRLRARG